MMQKYFASLILLVLLACTSKVDIPPRDCPRDQCSICGDGQIRGRETCDDANVEDGDGCSSTCGVEAGWQCSVETPSLCREICSDGIVVGEEGCDDNNLFVGDGCNDSCRVEKGYTCSGSGADSCDLCGNGVKKSGEQCDDANTVNGDGCSDLCTVELGWSCNDEVPSVCGPVCGDGIISGMEQCDDENTDADDGCSSTCEQEAGWICVGAGIGRCLPECGDGLVRGTEGCDDGNTISGDGCSGICEVEQRWMCDGSPSVCTGVCGDGFVRGQETCDDQNTAPNDGCAPTCQIERGYDCVNEPSICAVTCGDGIKFGNEGCDDGNLINQDGCDALCVVEPGWTCSGTDLSDCQPICGDGLVLGSETCDDGGLANDDGCDSSCQVETACGCSGEPSVCQCYLAPIRSIALGGQHSCVVLNDNSTYCWGSNDTGQAGGVGATSSPQTVPAHAATSSMARGLGRSHSCSRNGTSVQCWGANENGQLGNTAAGAFTRIPQSVNALTNVREVVNGGQHSCAVHTDGLMSCWGSNESGNLGDGSLTARSQPVPVQGVGGVVQASAGARHTCALMLSSVNQSGQISCWGDNAFGQLGLGELTSQNRTTGGFIVDGVSSFSQVSAGGTSSCGISGASVLCWGSNLFGQLGYAVQSGDLSPFPFTVGDLLLATKVSVGGHHACAIADGIVHCWGSNSHGQLGDGTTGGYRYEAQPVTGLPNLLPVDIVAGESHSCAVFIDGSARCWGSNEQGQLGNANFVDSSVPVPVLR